jgi:hypothetical protein
VSSTAHRRCWDSSATTMTRAIASCAPRPRPPRCTPPADRPVGGRWTRATAVSVGVLDRQTYQGVPKVVRKTA